MKIYKVLGSVTLSRFHPTFTGARLVAAESADAELLGTPAAENPDLLIVWDALGAGLGAKIAVSDGGEAAQPFRPELKAVDAYCSAILDTVNIDPQTVQQIKFQ
ncbi:EutN/CcmL family microcompartment protein [Aureliella helgolandensis]|uniref:Ethanolamine utilization protein EutN/carboxysome n=1 Tax=Aureliella helgolandensis TaxID=2527968 RepID=A0A518G044_9BACT|nr:EutN/CcmL family microcompartment protein [Aureliella helgolandensis]QDV21982.1 Ethanolamine utilization protein EutN/carboxysome [Aureliella helgolandensis]